MYYVQYAHARICSVRQQYVERGGALERLHEADLARLTAPSELALMLKIADYPDMLSRAAGPTSRRTTWPSTCATWRAPSIPITVPSASSWDDAALTQARLALLTACAQVLRNGLAVLGVSAPEKM
ncbi:DALR anticodon-binding domain-containing protein [Schlegelella aquatica]|uniref:DALR anticodon-binding domain-containing protein n=1 Tax=Caldimonas aquatica TaxID=376175 RepID=UPI0037515049